MSTWINVCRYHLIDRTTFAVTPWAVLAFMFCVNLAFTAAVPPGATGNDSLRGMLAGFFFCFGGLWAMTARSLPFGLALGVSRRSYYTGSMLLCLSLAAGDGLVFAVLQVIEGATGGWGMGMYFFRVPHILAGPWALTWLTSFVFLALMSAYGMWSGMIYRRWNHVGLLVFAAAHIIVLLTAVLVITWTHAWPHRAHAVAELTPAELIGFLAPLAAAMFAGGYATLRHVTV